ncbi:neuropeptide Y receptor type 2-like isoform X2 [Mytilus edulis]|uniref:neuropeptide Y receptor type 2-like isoform X2 n=1 Tax=Mytilus edulis TaxID=6550 RepID=UPI0039EE8DE0
MVNEGMLLEELNQEEAKQYVGGIIFVTFLMIIGIIGNLHVLFVYTFRIKPSNHRIFILSLAVLDMITCIVGMPFIIVDLRNPLTFTMVSACKVLRFVNYFICTSSALILTVIAIDRYRKICVPLGKQISKRIAKVLILVCLGTSMVLSWPAPVLYGHSSINTTNPNITGVRCFTEDQFKNTQLQAYFNAILILLVCVVFGILLVLYSLIGMVISKHTTFKGSVPGATSSDSSKHKITVSTDASSEDKPVFKGENVTKNINGANLKENELIDLPQASLSVTGTNYIPGTLKRFKLYVSRAVDKTTFCGLVLPFLVIRTKSCNTVHAILDMKMELIAD